MTKLQEYAAQLKEAVEKAISRMEKDARNIYEASELLRQCGHELAGTVYNCHFETLGAIEAAKSALRNLVPPLLEEMEGGSSPSEIDLTEVVGDLRAVLRDYLVTHGGSILEDEISEIPLADWLRSFVGRNGLRRG